jgi:hypothetical protein
LKIKIWNHFNEGEFILTDETAASEAVVRVRNSPHLANGDYGPDVVVDHPDPTEPPVTTGRIVLNWADNTRDSMTHEERYLARRFLRPVFAEADFELYEGEDNHPDFWQDEFVADMGRFDTQLGFTAPIEQLTLDRLRQILRNCLAQDEADEIWETEVKKADFQKVIDELFRRLS